MTSPRVSVIVTCHDLGEYLDDAVDSVLAQTMNDAEILITDDGAADARTCALLDAYDRPRTRVIRLPHRGLAHARNALIGEARGEFLCALDADDRLHPRYLEKALQAFEERPALTFVSSWAQMFGAQSGVWRHDRCDLPALLAECTVHTATLVRREAVVDAGGYDAAMPYPGYDDWELWLRLVASGHEGLILEEPLFYYRRRPFSMSSAYTDPDVHDALVGYLHRKHAAAYAVHWREVALARHHELARARRHEWQCRRRMRQLRPLLDGLRRTCGAAVGSADGMDASSGAGSHGPPDPLAAVAAATAALDEVRDWQAYLRSLEREVFHARQAAARADRELVTLSEEIEHLRSGLRRRHATRPGGSLTVAMGDLDRVTPLSEVWGLDRGRPIDRYYIETFLARHAEDVRGAVLEVKDPGYTVQFGGDRVTSSDVVDIDRANPHATIVGDLTDDETLPPGRFDCVILTQTLNAIYGAGDALATCWRSLAPGGVLLCTVSTVNRVSCEPGGEDNDYWRFTPEALRLLIERHCPGAMFTIEPLGNVFACTAFLYGLAIHEVPLQMLEATDSRFPLITAARIVKGSEGVATEAIRPGTHAQRSQRHLPARQGPLFDAQAELADVLLANRRRERRLRDELEPLLRRLTAERDRLRGKLRQGALT